MRASSHPSRNRSHQPREVGAHDAQRKAILSNIPDQAWLKDASCRYIAVDEAYVEACGIPEHCLIESFTERTGLAIEMSVRIDDAEYNREVRTAIYRILQESLTNASRHAEAKRIIVELRESSGYINLTVADDGKGIARGIVAVQSDANLRCPRVGQKPT